MRVKRVMVASALALSSLLAATQAAAQAFVGGSIGQSDIGDEFTGGLVDANANRNVDGKGTAFKVFGGYMFSQYLGVEGAFVSLGDMSYSGTFGAQTVTGGKIEVSGFNVAALGSYPVTEQFSVFGKVGLFLWDAEANDTTGGVPFSAKTDGTDISFGVGVGYNFTRNLGVRAEWELFKLDDGDANLISVGLLWRF